MAQLLRACGLVRMSSDQQDKSPDQQRGEVLKLASRLNAEVCCWFEDHGISGDNNRKRDGFQAMLKEASGADRRFDAILAWHIDRISRNDILDAAEWLRPLRAAGIRIVTCCQGEVDLNSFTGVISFTIQQEVAKQYLRDLSRNMCRSLAQRGKEGRAVSRPPYAYDRLYFDAAGRQVHRAVYGEKFRAPKGWRSELVPSQRQDLVETVRWLFEQFTAADRSLRDIAAELNRRGSLTPNGRPWRHDSVKELLSNPVYAGIYAFGKSRRGKYNQVTEAGDVAATVVRQKRCSPSIVIDQHHEAIVSPTLFRTAQDKLAGRASEGRKPRGLGFPLSGLLRCGCCGGLMSGVTQNSTRRYYTCSNAPKGTCVARRVPASQVERLLASHAQRVYRSQKYLAELREAIVREANSLVDSQGDRQAAIRTELATVEAQLEKATENLLLADAADFKAAQKIIARWRLRRDTLAGQLVPESPPLPLATAQAAFDQLGLLVERLTEASPPVAREAFRTLFVCVTIFWQPRTNRRWRPARAVIEPRELVAGNRIVPRQKVQSLEFPDVA